MEREDSRDERIGLERRQEADGTGGLGLGQHPFERLAVQVEELADEALHARPRLGVRVPFDVAQEPLDPLAGFGLGHRAVRGHARASFVAPRR